MLKSEKGIQTVSEKNIQWDFHPQEKVTFVPFNFIDERLRYNHLTEEVNKSHCM